MLQECLFLVKFGVPFDVAFSLDAETRLAWAVIIGEMESATHKWDWENLKWREVKR